MVPKSTVDYSGRLVDVELLQSVTQPGTNIRVYPAFTRVTEDGYTVPKMVTGLEKAIQRYANLLLTDIESMKFNEDIGGELVIRVFNGSVASEADLEHLFALANDSAMTAMAEDDNDPTFGDIPDDEKLVNARLDSSYIDYARATISLHIDLTFASGDTYTYIIPVTTGLQ